MTDGGEDAAPSSGLVDTSVFVAQEVGRSLRRELLPEVAAVSVITVAELRAGVLAAEDRVSRSLRLRTLEQVGDIQLLDIDHAVAMVWAELRVRLGATRRRVNVNDLWIAATAAAHDLPVITQDADFDAVEGVAGLRVVRV